MISLDLIRSGYGKSPQLIALVLSLLLHLGGFIFSYFFVMKETRKIVEPTIEITFEQPAALRSTGQPFAAPKKIPAPKKHRQTGTITIPPSVPITQKDKSQTTDVVALPRDSSQRSDTLQRLSTIPSQKNVLDKDMTEEEAFSLLSKLLDRHPEFRESIMRQMLAGPQADLTPAYQFDLQLDRWLKNPDWLLTNKFAWESMRNARSPYDPIHGFDRDKKLGIQFPYLSILIRALQFLYDLIEEK